MFVCACFIFSCICYLTQVNERCWLLAVHPAVCGGRSGASDARSEVQRAEDHVPASGHRRSVLQPSPAHPHPGQHAHSAEFAAHHGPLHQPVDE